MTDKEDELFFEQAMSDVKKIRHPNRVVLPAQTKTKRQTHEQTSAVLKTFHHELELDTTADIDKQTMRRFKREEFGVEAELDLHGFTIDKAFDAVKRFIISSFNQNKRAVLIVTGKGLPHPEQDIFETKGVLRQHVPMWLKSDELKAMILTFIHPSAKLGGSGALYILLRRKR